MASLNIFIFEKKLRTRNKTRFSFDQIVSCELHLLIMVVSKFSLLGELSIK